jgi:hypothetical protein
MSLDLNNVDYPLQHGQMYADEDDGKDISSSYIPIHHNREKLIACI